MDVIDWLMDHSELWYVTLAENGYDSYYPEYEEYFYKTESHHFSQQVLMIIMILLSKYQAQIFLTNDENELLETIDEKDLEKIHNAIIAAVVEDKDAVYILLTDDEGKQFGAGIAGELSLYFFNMSPVVKEYIKKLVSKVGLSMFLDDAYWG